MLVAQLVKNPPEMQETWVDPWAREDPLEKETAAHSSEVLFTTKQKWPMGGW